MKITKRSAPVKKPAIIPVRKLLLGWNKNSNGRIRTQLKRPTKKPNIIYIEESGDWDFSRVSTISVCGFSITGKEA